MSTQGQLAGLKTVEEQLTCPLCLEHFTNPKILPCFHSFCLRCVQAVPVVLVDGSRSLICPTCRSPYLVPDEGLVSLPPSFVINNLMDAYDLMKKVSDRQHVSCGNCDNTNAGRYCKQCAKFFCQQCLHHHNNWKPFANHQNISLDEVSSSVHQLPHEKAEKSMTCSKHDEPIKLFCETCQEVVCRDCTLTNHKFHDYNFIAETYPHHKDTVIKSSLQPLNQEFDRLTKAKEILTNKRNETSRQADKAKREIHVTIEQIKNRLDQTEKDLIEDVDSVAKHKVMALDQQLKELDVALGLVAECKDHVDQLVNVGSPQQVLSTKPQMISRSQSIVESVKDKTFEPLEQPVIELVKSGAIDELHNNVASVKCTLHPMKVDSSYRHIPLVGQESSISISLFLPDGSPAPIPSSRIKCHLTTPGNTPPMQCTVEQSSQSTGQYNVVFTPHTRGLHQLHVTNGIIPGSPVSVHVSVPPEMRGTPVKKFSETVSFGFKWKIYGIISGVRQPSGVAVTDDGLIVVSDHANHCIVIFNSEGKKIRSFGAKGNKKGQLAYPRGVAVTSKGTILVSDSNNYRIQEFTVEGDCISSVGTYGEGPLEFSCPCGIHVNKTTGQIFVSDLRNNHVQVLHPDLTFSHLFGRSGTGQGEFKLPVDMTIDSQGFVYVTDRNSYRVQKFTCEGHFVTSFGQWKPGRLHYPSGITVDDNDLLYINNEFNGYVMVYTTDGRYVTSIDKTDYNNDPHSLVHLNSISFDSYGNLLICCSNVIKVL